MSDVDIPEPVPEKKASRKPRPSEIAKKAAKEQAEFKASIEPKPAALPKAAKAKTAPKPKSKAKAKEKPSGLILSRSYQRGGTVGVGTERPSGSMQATIVFEARQLKKLQVAARKNGVSFGEQVRQCVSTALAA